MRGEGERKSERKGEFDGGRESECAEGGSEREIKEIE